MPASAMPAARKDFSSAEPRGCFRRKATVWRIIQKSPYVGLRSLAALPPVAIVSARPSENRLQYNISSARPNQLQIAIRWRNDMAKLIGWNLITVDGCFEGAKKWDLDFHTLAWGPELERLSEEFGDKAASLVFGRVT